MTEIEQLDPGPVKLAEMKEKYGWSMYGMEGYVEMKIKESLPRAFSKQVNSWLYASSSYYRNWMIPDFFGFDFSGPNVVEMQAYVQPEFLLSN